LTNIDDNLTIMSFTFYKYLEEGQAKKLTQAANMYKIEQRLKW